MLKTLNFGGNDVNTHMLWIMLGVYGIYAFIVGVYEGVTGKRVWEYLESGKLPPRQSVDAQDGTRWESVGSESLSERIFRRRRKGATSIERRLPH